MKKTSILTLFFSAIVVGCIDKKEEYNIEEYTMTISYMDAETHIKKSERTVIIPANDDTTAYKEAVDRYWAHKAAILITNKDRRETADHLPVPYYFTLAGSGNRVISFEKEKAERLAAWTLRYIRDSTLSKFDTITSLINGRAKEPANIY